MDRLGFKLQWYPRSATSAASNPAAGTSTRHTPDSDVSKQHQEHGGPVPLVVLLPWMFAKPGQILNKFITLVHECGWDACVFQPPVMALWAPPLAQALAQHLATTLEQTLAHAGKRPIVFAAFSGAPKAVYASLLDLLNCGRDSAVQVARGTPHAPAHSTVAIQAAGSTYCHQADGSTPCNHSVAPTSSTRQQPQQLTGTSEQTQPLAVHPRSASSRSPPSRPLLPATQTQRAEQLQQADSRPAIDPASEGGQGLNAAPHSASRWQQVVELILQPNTQPRPLLSSLQPPSSDNTWQRQACAFPLLQRCMCGQWFDSGPVDFTSLAGCSMLAPPGSGWLRRAVVNSAGAAMDLLAAEAWDRQRACMWYSLLGPASVQQPTLICFSWDDHIADPRRIHGFADALRLQGADVVEMAWQASEHCAHLRHHKQDYKQAVKELLAKAQVVYERRLYGRLVGSQVASSSRLPMSQHDAAGAAMRADNTHARLPLQSMLTRSRL